MHFFPVFARLRRENAKFCVSMEDVNKQRRNVFSLSELGYGPLIFSFRRVRLHLTKWVGIIAIKNEGTQVHFFFFVVVASLDLKVPI